MFDRRGRVPSGELMAGILCWNCRGARKKAASNYLRQIVGDHNIGFVGLVETKVESFSRKDIKKLAGRNWSYVYQPSVGKSGGILAMWKNDSMAFQVVMQSEQCFMGKIQFHNGHAWEVAVVYANKDSYVRRNLWNDVSKMHEKGAPLLVCGDFHCILSQEEKKGGKPFRYTSAVREMEEFIGIMDLHDPGFVGPKYTWTNNKDTRSKIWARLDRCLVNAKLLESCQNLWVKHLTRIASDHCPMLCMLQEESRRRVSNWFQFEDICISYPVVWKLV